MNAQEALKRLQDGNARFTSDTQSPSMDTSDAARTPLAGGQKPWVIILGCSDSRVPLELTFDQGLGDIFVIRVAGNIASTEAIASIEYAASSFGTPLLVVLGHSSCGAVTAAVNQVDDPSQDLSPSLNALVDQILPAAQTANDHATDDERLPAAIRENVKLAMEKLYSTSTILSERIDDGSLTIVGGEYSLASGAVDFFATKGSGISL